jgi:hypothetical protein
MMSMNADSFMIIWFICKYINAFFASEVRLVDLKWNIQF